MFFFIYTFAEIYVKKNNLFTKLFTKNQQIFVTQTLITRICMHFAYFFEGVDGVIHKVKYQRADSIWPNFSQLAKGLIYNIDK